MADLARRAGRNYDSLIKVLDAAPFFKHGEQHRRNRRTLSKLINHIPLNRLEPVIYNISSSLSSRLAGLFEYDAVEQFAEPLPQYVMAHILGLPSSDVPILSDLLAQVTLIFEHGTLDLYDRINTTVIAALDLLKSRVREAVRNSASADGGLFLLYEDTAGPENERLADAAAMAVVMFRVGAETTIALLGFIIRTLVRRPTLYHSVRANLDLAPVVVSEVLRLESSVQRAIRVGQSTSVIGGKTIRAGERVLLLLNAANRDPTAFAEPDDLIMDRTEVADVAFGGGSHYCIAANLARLEGRIAGEHFVKLAQVEQTGDEAWYSGRVIRRLNRLPVRVMSGRDG